VVSIVSFLTFSCFLGFREERKKEIEKEVEKFKEITETNKAWI
jgi:hypothetical protein